MTFDFQLTDRTKPTALLDHRSCTVTPARFRVTFRNPQQNGSLGAADFDDPCAVGKHTKTVLVVPRAREFEANIGDSFDSQRVNIESPVRTPILRSTE